MGEHRRPVYGPMARLVGHAAVGFAFGFFVLHPFSMIIFRGLDPAYAHGMPEIQSKSYLETMSYSFHPGMLGMGMVYGWLTSLIAVVNGYQRMIIQGQRDRLAAQLKKSEQDQMELERRAERLRHQNAQLNKLETANRRATQFMVHDLKNYVGCIVGFSDLLLDDEAARQEEQTRRKLGLIRRQALQMRDDIGGFLDLARLKETGRIKQETIAVPDLLRQAVDDFQLPDQTDHVRIGESVDHCPPILGDRQLLKRVLTNLIANALQHNPPETRVVVDAEFRPDHADLLFSCRDNGQGIAPGILPDLFAEFSADAGEHGESSGLGLAFCKTVVEAHDGRIWCESQANKGSCFSFNIPIQKGKRT